MCVCVWVCVPTVDAAVSTEPLGSHTINENIFFQIYKDTFSDAFCMFGGVSSINIQLTARRRRRWWNFAL